MEIKQDSFKDKDEYLWTRPKIIGKEEPKRNEAPSGPPQ
jgi:hypothetical protein